MTDDALLTLEGWARDGLSDAQIAHNIGITDRSFSDWKGRFVSISSALKKGRKPVEVEVENALLKRALGYEYEETIEEVEELPTDKRDGNGNIIYKKKRHMRRVKKVMPPDPVAMIFWLKNKKPLQWRDRPEPPMSNEALEKLDEVLESIKGVV